MTSYTSPNHNGKIVVTIDVDIETLIPGFLEHRSGDIQSILEALAQSDYEVIQNLGHSMKGIGGSYGFDFITDLGHCLEQAAKEENPTEIRNFTHALSDYLERVEVVYQ